MSPETITANLTGHFSVNPPRRDREEIMEIILDTFRQVGRAPAAISEAAAESEEVAAAAAKEALEDQDEEPGFDFD